MSEARSTAAGGIAPAADDPLRPGPYSQALVVVNPISGQGQGAKAAVELAEGLRRLGASTEVFTTSGPGDAFTHLRSLGRDLDLVVAVGGDGTVREVLEGLVDPEVPVGILPFGTANVLAMDQGFPRDVHHALEILGRRRLQCLDVARVNGHLSFLVVGVGIDALAVEEVARRRRGPITKWTYVEAMLRVLKGYRPPRLRVVLDDDVEEEAGLVLVSNIKQYGGFMHLAEGTRLDDGEFEVYLFPTARLFELLTAVCRGVLRRLPGGAIRMRRARRVRIEADEPVPYQVDGDLGGKTPVEVTVSPVQYRLVVP